MFSYPFFPLSGSGTKRNRKREYELSQVFIERQTNLLFSIAVISMTILNAYWLKYTGLQKTLTMCLVVADMESYHAAREIFLLES